MLSSQATRARPLAALLILMILAQGAAGLFALWRNHAEQARSRAELAAIAAGLDAARMAQTAFHVQVQEWKNILLRGHDAAIRTRHEQAFQSRATAVDQALGVLGTRAEAARQRHGAVSRSYGEVLASADLVSGDGARAADARLRGLDRDLQTLLDSLSAAMAAEHAAALTAAALREAEDYAAMRTMLLITGGIGLLASLGLMIAAGRS
ncbi:MAG: hypothetical protein NTW56_03080 [Alphaproteobacteria bacterium]|nr:hypothetical protein [Alphaproteobacteria bacterium]